MQRYDPKRLPAVNPEPILDDHEPVNPSDVEAGVAIGGIGGAVTGAIAGAVMGPLGSVAGAAIGGLAGAAASGIAVSYVDQRDNDYPMLHHNELPDHNAGTPGTLMEDFADAMNGVDPDHEGKRLVITPNMGGNPLVFPPGIPMTVDPDEPKRKSG